jgi:transposase
MCEEIGVRLEFLPPYSPDYNLIEDAFADFKVRIKKYTYANRDICSISLLKAGLRQSVKMTRFFNYVS